MGLFDGPQAFFNPIKDTINDIGNGFNKNIIEPVKDVWENNDVVDFVKKNNAVAIITNPDDSSVVQTIKGGWSDLTEGVDNAIKGAQGGLDGFTKDVQKTITNIGDGIGQALPYVAIGGAALILVSILLRK